MSSPALAGLVLGIALFQVPEAVRAKLLEIGYGPSLEPSMELYAPLLAAAPKGDAGAPAGDAVAPSSPSAKVTEGDTAAAASRPAATRRTLSKKEMKALAEALPPKYRDFLTLTELIITPDEKEVFLQIKEDYQRDKFIEAARKAGCDDTEETFAAIVRKVAQAPAQPAEPRKSGNPRKNRVKAPQE